HAKKELPKSEAQLFSQFVRLYYSQAHLDDFENQTPENLYGMAKSHWELVKQRQPKELKIRVFNPDKNKDGWESDHTIIEVIADDMPFIVDSMRMELNRIGLMIHVMIYMGGMKVERDNSGKLLDILPYNSSEKDVDIESPIYMEIDRKTEKDVLATIQSNIERVLADVRSCVEDWSSMQRRLRDTIEDISGAKMPQKPAEVNETIAFLEWMLEDHFTFLGARDYERAEADDGSVAMRLIPGTGLGVLRDESRSQVIRKYSEIPKAAREIALSKDQILIISKTNTRSTVHRPTYTDYIGVKLFDKKGNVIKERRFIGLYTSSAYNANPKAIPVIRKKVASIFNQSGLPARSHAGKDLMH
ncbi:MAG: NAD-glutamate dehydrogenase, partial [Coxiellaceae bacterium]|nr:NAD-glutamate dehydrogenase [Coxiellaceae bacterium]